MIVIVIYSNIIIHTQPPHASLFASGGVVEQDSSGVGLGEVRLQQNILTTHPGHQRAESGQWQGAGGGRHHTHTHHRQPAREQVPHLIHTHTHTLLMNKAGALVSLSPAVPDERDHQSTIHLVSYPLPLPYGAVESNKRAHSYIYIGNYKPQY